MFSSPLPSNVISHKIIHLFCHAQYEGQRTWKGERIRDPEPNARR